ncbi:hypothetical protein SAMN06298212_10851 [Ruaniaceae bacterium KH17]|nr:hypothetical protein SAMN06298212_10851 [Ruaniaceae bacterium KH17]
MSSTASLPAILHPENDARARELLSDYFTSQDWEGHPKFSGAKFESLGHAWNETETSNKITASDLLAVSCLSVNVPATATIDILGASARGISELLAAVPDTNLPIWAPEAAYQIDDPESEMQQLWRHLRSYKDMGPVKTSKLMARKRPNLIPIYDDVVGAALGIPNSLGHWTTMREQMLIEQSGGSVARTSQGNDRRGESRIRDPSACLRCHRLVRKQPPSPVGRPRLSR